MRDCRSGGTAAEADVVTMGLTLFEKLWREHLVESYDDGTDLIYIDRIFLHERTGSIALASLEAQRRRVFCPEQVFCTMDHIVDTYPDRSDETTMPSGREFIVATREHTRAAGITLFDLDDPRQGIVHVVSPEQGIVQPGISLVCPDSHTCTQGALGALAWGIGSSEAEHALATKTLRVARPQTMRVRFDGSLRPGVSAKDMILHLIATHGANGARGCAVEFSGQAVAELGMEARMTLCNMAVEFSAFTGLIAPDDKTIEYLRGRPYAPAGPQWAQAVNYWQTLQTAPGARFDRELIIDCSMLEPQVTWGTSPEHAVGICARVPGPCRRRCRPRQPAAGAGLYGCGGGPGAGGHAHRRSFHRLLYQQPYHRPAPGGRHPAGPEDCAGPARHLRARFDAGESPGRGGRPGSHLYRCRLRVARLRLLHVLLRRR